MTELVPVLSLYVPGGHCIPPKSSNVTGLVLPLYSVSVPSGGPGQYEPTEQIIQLLLSLLLHRPAGQYLQPMEPSPLYVPLRHAEQVA